MQGCARRSIRGHGADGVAADGVDEVQRRIAQICRRGALDTHADGIAIGREQVGLHDEGRARVGRCDGGQVADEELSFELEIAEAGLGQG